jgi:hypothetical protein
VKDMFPEKDGMLEFDIDILPPRKWRELERYVRKVKGDSRKPVRISTNTPKGLVKQRSTGFPTAKNGMPPSSGGLGGNPSDYGRKGMMSGGLDLGHGGKAQDDSSESDSESSNSSIRSNPNLGANSLNKQSFSHAPPHIGGPGGLN